MVESCICIPLIFFFQEYILQSLVNIGSVILEQILKSR